MKSKSNPLNLLYAVLFGIVLLSCLAGCRDEDMPLTLEEKLEGAWERTWIDFTQTYSFDGHGQCIVYGIVPGQPVQIYAYAYEIDGDTLTMIDLASSPKFRDVSKAVLIFPTDSTAVLSWVDGVEYKLTRL